MYPNSKIYELESLLRQIGNQININTRCFLAERGLTLARFWVMNKLSVDKPLTMGELRKRLSLSPATITGLVDNLVEGNIVKRWRNEDDRRVVFLTLTPQGKKLLDEVIEHRVSIIQSSLEKINAREIVLLNNFLRILLGNLIEMPLTEEHE